MIAEVAAKLRSAMKSHVQESIEARVDPVFITSETEGRLWDAASDDLKQKMGDSYVEALIKGSPVGARLKEDWTENALLCHELESLHDSHSPHAKLRRTGHHTGDQARFGHFHLTKDNAKPAVHWDFYDVTEPAGLAGHALYDWGIPLVKRRTRGRFSWLAAGFGQARAKTLEEMVVLCGQMQTAHSFARSHPQSPVS